METNLERLKKGYLIVELNPALGQIQDGSSLLMLIGL